MGKFFYSITHFDLFHESVKLFFDVARLKYLYLPQSSDYPDEERPAYLNFKRGLEGIIGNLLYMQIRSESVIYIA